MSKCLYCQTELPEGYGMVCSSCEKDLLNYSEDCSKYLIDNSEYVKVVRCKDCITAIGFGEKTVEPDEVGICKMTQMCVAPRDYCSYGKRRMLND